MLTATWPGAGKKDTRMYSIHVCMYVEVDRRAEIVFPQTRTQGCYLTVAPNKQATAGGKKLAL